MSGDPRPLGQLSAAEPAAALWSELLHDWRVLSEHDGGYTLLRCRVCGTDVVR